MKLHKILCLIFTVMILTSTITLTCVEARKYRPRTRYKDFSLYASGRAYDRQQHKMVDVTISLHGKAKTCGNTWKIAIKGGSITVEGQQQLFAYKGTATLIPKHGYINLHIFTESQYGHRKTVWNLKGRVHETTHDRYQGFLKASRVYLPIWHYPKLSNLKLSTTINLN